MNAGEAMEAGREPLSEFDQAVRLIVCDTLYMAGFAPLKVANMTDELTRHVLADCVLLARGR